MAELEAEANELGGQNIDAIVGRMMERVTEKGEFREAVFRLVYRSVAAGIVSAPFDLPEIALEEDVNWQMMDVNAYSFAENYTYDLVKGINQTTERGLRNALTRWIEDGGTMDDLVESIRPVFANEAATRRIESLFKVDRARMIAVTEATRAYVQGKVQYWAAQGFAVPREAPPKHVNCRCDIGIKRDEFGNYWWVWLTAKDEKVCPLCNPYTLNPQISIGKAADGSTPAGVTPPETTTQLDPTLQAVLAKAEADIRNIKTHEVGIGFTPDGKEVFRKKGEAHSVPLTVTEFKNLRWKIFTHNHPSGCGLSANDWVFAFQSGVSELRAVGEREGDTFTYRLQPGKAGRQWFEKQGDKFFIDLTQRIYSETWEELSGKHYRGELSKNETRTLWPELSSERIVEYLKKEGVELFYDMEVNL